MGFGVPLAGWFPRGPLRPMLDELLGPRAQLYDLLQRNSVSALRAAHDRGEDKSARLWLLLTHRGSGCARCNRVPGAGTLSRLIGATPPHRWGRFSPALPSPAGQKHS